MYIASTEKCNYIHLGLARKLRSNYASCLILWLRIANKKPSHETGRRLQVHQFEFNFIVTVTMTVKFNVLRNIHLRKHMEQKWYNYRNSSFATFRQNLL